MPTPGLTRRQLLVRSGGAVVAITCFGALPGGAVAGPAALSSERAGTYAAVLDALDADAGYQLADRTLRARRFAELYAAADDPFRTYADAALDAIEHAPAHRAFSTLAPSQAHRELATWGGRLTADALQLASLPFTEDDDTHTILFTV